VEGNGKEKALHHKRGLTGACSGVSQPALQSKISMQEKSSIGKAFVDSKGFTALLASERGKHVSDGFVTRVLLQQRAR
jgi:hypothetical protein